MKVKWILITILQTMIITKFHKRQNTIKWMQCFHQKIEMIIYLWSVRVIILEVIIDKIELKNKDFRINR